ncbi:MAG: heavy metal translocating P-type ATPase [Candidatus Binatia bacterium]|nr:heavy metal translocating P-type ATPase [Candidatus Binatia bacterium]
MLERAEMMLVREDSEFTCFHCALPLGNRPLRYQAEGVLRPFCCYGCYLVFVITGQHGEQGESLLVLARLVVGVTCGMVVMIFSWSHYADLYLFHSSLGEPDALGLFVKIYVVLAATLVMAVLGLPILRNAVRNFATRNLGVDALIALGAFSAYGASLLATLHGVGETYYDTATMILVFVTLGRFLEAKGRTQASKAIQNLKSLVPDMACVLRSNSEALLPIAQIGPGEKVLIRPGETVPVDGVILDGTGSLNEAPLTGESKPVMREPGDRLLAGTISLDGAFVVQVTAAADERAIARLARLAEDAKRIKPAIVGLADQVSAVFTLAVIVLAVGALFFWSLRLGFAPGLLIALSVLLIACPCALGVATPLVFWTGLAIAARRGILIRSGIVLERLARINHVFFDKTGTLTTGSFHLREILTPGSADALGKNESKNGLSPLLIAASLESRSEHPVAAALRTAAAEAGLSELLVKDWRVEPGLGVRGRIDGVETEYLLGSSRFVRQAALIPEPAIETAVEHWAERGETLVYLGAAGKLTAAFAVGEQIREEAADTLARLRKLGVSTTVITGDGRWSAERLGATLGIPDIRWGLLPHEKVAEVQAAQAKHKRAAMIGDGINDAASLAAAEVGIALGCGADLAQEAADVVMASADLTQVPWLLGFGRRVRRVVATNLVWAFAYNTIGVGLALAGWLPPVLAALAMVLSSLFVVGNTRRLYAAAEKR